MKYLDEVGHLGGLDPRTSVDLGIAVVYAEPGGDLRFEGHDLKGKLWRVWIPPAAGIGGTDVWTADFDRNGRQDLLIAAYFPSNGRCTDGAEIYTLMFDDLGRPMPWLAHSNSFTDFERPPVPIVDANGDGRAEMVTVSCEYSPPGTVLGDDRRISGVYEAKDARWLPIRNAPEDVYLAAAKGQLSQRPPGTERWLETDPASWPDFLAGYDSQPTAQIRSVITAAVGCGGIRLAVVNGRVVRPTDDPCDLLRYNQVVYSDGKPRQGWPFVVIDSSDGRDLFFSDAGAALRNALRMGYRFKILEDAASPDLLWMDTRTGAQIGQVSCRLRMGEVKRVKLSVGEQLPSGLGLSDVTLSVGQRCLVFRPNGENPPAAAELQNCPAIAKLQRAGVTGGTITIRESEAWQVLPGRNLLRILRSNDGGQIGAIQFGLPRGMAGTIVAAVAFNDGWLTEWQSGSRRWLLLYSRTGKPISTAMELPIDGELFDSQNYDGLHFLKWERGKPAELITVPASVEWSRALDPH
ncbi:MAG: hypothetical protein ABSC23_21705 [Bryobacteraceae bacterium]|jgi:hypothetical protein